jgi:hypothetical protein
MLPYVESSSAFKSGLTGRVFKFDPTNKESRRKALADLEASDAELADAIQARAERELGRKLTERELLSGNWAPDNRSRHERDCDELAARGSRYNPYESRLAVLDAQRISLTPAEREALELKAAAWQPPKAAELVGQRSPYASAIRDLTTRTTHDPDERRRNASLLERYKTLDEQWHADHELKAEAEKRRADPVYVNAVENAEAVHKFLNLMHGSKQQWVQDAKARLDKLQQAGPDGVDEYWSAARAFDERMNAELDAAAKSIDGRVEELQELKQAVLKGDAPVDAAKPAEPHNLYTQQPPAS